MSEALMNEACDALETLFEEATVVKSEVEILIPADCLVEALYILRDDETMAMNQLVDLCGADYPDRASRFDVVYHLLSLKNNARLRLRVELEEGQSVPTATSVYSSAGWFERETFDLFGIVFDGHPDLRRILTDYDFEGHPLRRDFPLTGFTQVRYDDLKQCVVKESVALEKEYRAFDAASPWEGTTDVQKRNSTGEEC